MLHSMAREKNKKPGVCTYVHSHTNIHTYIHTYIDFFFKSRADAKVFGASCNQLQAQSATHPLAHTLTVQ